MDSIIDSRGNLFGLVNIIDTLVVLLLVAVVTAGAALVSESVLAPLGAVGLGLVILAGFVTHDTEVTEEDNQDDQSQHIQLQISNIEPPVAAAINVHDTTIDGDLVVTDRRTEPASVVVDTEDGMLAEQTHPRLRTVTLLASIQAEQTGTDYFRGDRLYVGRELNLDLDNTRIEATIVGIGDELPPETTLEREDIGSGKAAAVAE